MRYAVIFDYDPDSEAEPEFKNGLNIYSIETPTSNIKIEGTLRVLPPRIPASYYEYETYATGYAKGNNDVLDKLDGKNGEYDPETDKVSP